MASPRRRGSETSETRSQILDETERIIVAEGYAAVSSRSVARAAGVTPALVHYYFGTLDELFLAVLRRRADQQLERQRRMLESSPTPLRVLWEDAMDPARTKLVLEFAALANHRKVVATEIAAYATRYREVQLETLGERLGRTRSGSDAPSPMAVLVLINAIATDLVLEQSVGMTLGHDEAVVLVEQWVDRLDTAAG